MRKIVVLAAATALFGSMPAGAVEIDAANPVHVLVVARAVAVPCKIKVSASTDADVAALAVGEWGDAALPNIKNIAFKVGILFEQRSEADRAAMCRSVREMLR